MNERTVTVRVLKPGVFNGKGHKALPHAQEGAVLEVASGGYAESLASDGWVELVDETPAVVELVTPEVPPAPPVPLVETVVEASLAEGWVEIPPAGDEAPPDPVQEFVRLNGVGTSIAHKLVDAGYTLTTLATADPQKVRAVVGGSVKRIEEWQAEAQQLLGH